jgi:hypothetical protein
MIILNNSIYNDLELTNSIFDTNQYFIITYYGDIGINTYTAIPKYALELFCKRVRKNSIYIRMYNYTNMATTSRFESFFKKLYNGQLCEI